MEGSGGDNKEKDFFDEVDISTDGTFKGYLYKRNDRVLPKGTYSLSLSFFLSFFFPLSLFS